MDKPNRKARRAVHSVARAATNGPTENSSTPVPNSDGRLLSWRWVEHRLSNAKTYHVTTRGVREPASYEVRGVWMSPHIIFSCPGSMADALRMHASVQIDLEERGERVVLLGEALPLKQVSPIPDWLPAYSTKYGWQIPGKYADVFVVEPARLLGRGHAAERQDTTEWLFA